jgi:uridine phosphorylase
LADPSGQRHIPLLEHPLDAPTIFKPEDLVAAVRSLRRTSGDDIPPLCILEFDGDLTDELVAANQVIRCAAWPCFHSTMWLWHVDGRPCGIISRTIGGPYAVLIAEQLAVCGVRAIIGLTSAGRVAPDLPVPGVVVADQAIRDEGTSYHYLPAARTVAGQGELADALQREVASAGLPVRRGLVWTTDAPYRETAEQMEHHARAGALAVEMQAASLFAFAASRGVATGLLAHVTNSPTAAEQPFGAGTANVDRRLLEAACRAGWRYVLQSHRP